MKDSPTLSNDTSKSAPKKEESPGPPLDQQSFSLSEAELFSQLPQAIGPSLFLDRFTADDMLSKLKSSRFLSSLLEKGIRKPQIVIQRVEPDEHRLLLYDESESEPIKMVELRMTLERLELPEWSTSFLGRNVFDMLSVNWAMLQNPRSQFTAERPALPGQEYPGLGLGRKCQEFLVQLATELHRHGLINHPQYFHNAVFYRDAYYFSDPEKQGEFQAMVRDLMRYPIAASSKAIAEGKLMETRGRQMIDWHPEAMVCPIRRRLRKYFESSKYRRLVEASMKSHSFDLTISTSRGAR